MTPGPRQKNATSVSVAEATDRLTRSFEAMDRSTFSATPKVLRAAARRGLAEAPAIIRLPGAIVSTPEKNTRLAVVNPPFRHRRASVLPRHARAKGRRAFSCVGFCLFAPASHMAEQSGRNTVCSTGLPPTPPIPTTTEHTDAIRSPRAFCGLRGLPHPLLCAALCLFSPEFTYPDSIVRRLGSARFASRLLDAQQGGFKLVRVHSASRVSLPSPSIPLPNYPRSRGETWNYPGLACKLLY